MIHIPDRLPPSIVAFLVILAFVLGVFAGYTLRINQERVSGANVVLADMAAIKPINEKLAEDVAKNDEYKKRKQAEELHDCETRPTSFIFSDLDDDSLRAKINNSWKRAD